ncbi:sulfur carrier protein ThiS [Algibacter sp. AS12]|uniref:sulfur carrier protein ThiS n=1 Tax=Algibacter sp. AS12 TaxID=3135773 RepID=UPI00398AFAEA
MYIKVNNTAYQIPEQTTVQQLVEQLKMSTNGIAVAINQHVVKNTNWPSTIIKNQDDILIIKSTQGG